MDQDRDERMADYAAKAREMEDSHAKAAERLQAACERRVEVTYLMIFRMLHTLLITSDHHLVALRN